MRIRSVAPILLVTLGISSPGHAQQEWYTGAASTREVQTFGAAIDASLTGTSAGSMHGSVIGTIAPFTCPSSDKLRQFGA